MHQGFKYNPKAIILNTNNMIARINIPLLKQHKHFAKSPCVCLNASNNRIVRPIKTIATIGKAIINSSSKNGAILKKNITAKMAANIKATTKDRHIHNGDTLHIQFSLPLWELIGLCPMIYNMKIRIICHKLYIKYNKI